MIPVFGTSGHTGGELISLLSADLTEPRTLGSRKGCIHDARDWRHRRLESALAISAFRLTLGGGSGLALGGVLDVRAMRAATADLKLSNISEFTTSCNFCSCGCGMIAAVRDGKLMKMEGDDDHIVNRGSLCVKGISMFATHASPQRLTKPRYRAPGSDSWEEISWDDAIARVAKKIRKTRDVFALFVFQRPHRIHS